MAIPTREQFYQQYDAAKQQGMDSNQAINYLAQAAVAAQPYNKQTTSTPQKIDTWQPGNRIPTRSEFNAERGITDTWQPPKTQYQTYDANAALAALQKTAATTTDKQLAKFINKYANKSGAKDNFWGQSAANFDYGKLNQQVMKAWNDWADDQSDEKLKTAQAYQQLADLYRENNASALDDENVKLKALSKDIAGYLPQFINQAKATAAPAAVLVPGGALLGEASTPIPIADAAGGAVLGYKTARTIGSGLYGYQVTRGAAANTLLNGNYDLKNDQIVNMATDEAIISSIIESGDTAWDMFVKLPGVGKAVDKLAGFGGKAASALLKRTTLSAVTSFLENPITKWATEAIGEGNEEFLQEALSIANERRAARKDTDSGIAGLLNETIGVLAEMAQGSGDENLQRAVEAWKGGATIGAIFNPAQQVAYDKVINPIENKLYNTVTEAAENKHFGDEIKKYIGGHNSLTNEEKKLRTDSYDEVSKQFSGVQRGDHLVDADGNEVGTVKFHGTGGYVLDINGNEEVVFAGNNNVYGSIDPESTVYKTLTDGGRIVTDDQYKIAQEQKAASAEADMTPEERAEVGAELGFDTPSAEEIEADHKAREEEAFQAERQRQEDIEMQSRYAEEQMGQATSKTVQQEEAPAEKAAPVVKEEQKEQPKADKVEQPAPMQNNLTSPEEAFIAFPKQRKLNTTIDGNNVTIKKQGSKGNYSYTIAVGKNIIAEGKTVSEAKQNAQAYFASQKQASQIAPESPQSAPKSEDTSTAPIAPSESTEQPRELVAPERSEEKVKEKTETKPEPAQDKKYTKSFNEWRKDYLENRTEPVALTDEAKALDSKLSKAKSNEWLSLIKQADTATLENLLQNMAKTSQTDGQTGTIAKWIYDELKQRETPKVYQPREQRPQQPSKTPEERRAEAKAKAPKVTEAKQKEINERLKKEEIERIKKRKEKQSLTDGFMESMFNTTLDPENISMSLYDDQQLYSRIAAAGEALGVKHRKGEKYYDYINRVLEEAYGVEDAIPMGMSSKESEKSDEFANLDDEEKDPTTFRIDQEYNRVNDTVEDDEGKSVRIAVSGGVGNLDMPKVLAENIRRNKERLADLDKKISEFEDDGRAPTQAQLKYRDSLQQQIAEDQEDMKAYQYHNKYAELVGLLSHYADADGNVDIPYVSDESNPTLGDIIKALDKAQNTEEFEFDSDMEEQLKTVLGVDDVWNQPANKLLAADENAEEWIPPEVARKNAKNKTALPDSDAERQLKIIKDSADELAARDKLRSTEKGAKYVDDESGLSSKDVSELSNANRKAYDALSQDEKILAEEIKNAIGYTEETKDGVTTVDYDWMALSAILSNPNDNIYIDLGRYTGEAEPLHHLINALQAIVPSDNATETNEYRVERNERGESTIVKAKDGRVDTRTINELLAGKEFIEKQAKKLAKDFKSDYDEDPKRRSSWLTADLVKASDVYEQYKKTHQKEYQLAKSQGKDAEDRFFVDFMKQHSTKAMTNPHTGETFFATNGFGMLHSIVSSDLISKAKTFMDKARTEGEAAKAKWNKKLTELYNKRSNTSDVKEVKKINQQIKTAEKRIADSDAYLYALDNYDIKLSDATQIVFREGRKKIKLFEDLTDEQYETFKNFSVKGLANGVSEELVTEIFDKIAEDTYGEQILRDLAAKDHSGGYIDKETGRIFPQKAAQGNSQENEAGRSGGETVESTPSGEQSGGERTGGESGQPSAGDTIANSAESGSGGGTGSKDVQVSEGKQSSGRTQGVRKLKKYKSRTEKLDDWHTIKAEAEPIKKAADSATALAKTVKASGARFSKAVSASLTNNGIENDAYAFGVIAYTSGRTIDQAASEDKRFNSFGKSAAKLNADVKICDVITRTTNDGATVAAGGVCCSRFENGELKHTLYANNYDNSLHEENHAAFASAAFANFGKNKTDAGLVKAKAEASKVVGPALEQSFNEAKLPGFYKALTTLLKQYYPESAITEEIYVEVAARAFNGSRNGTFSTWGVGGHYVDEAARLLRERSPTFNELVAAINQNARDYAKQNAKEVGKDIVSGGTLSSLLEDIEAGMGASNEDEIYSKEDWGSIYQTLDEMSRASDQNNIGKVYTSTWTDEEGNTHTKEFTSKGYRANEGKASTDQQRRQSFYDDMNAPSEIMADLAESLEKARPHSNFKTAKDLYDMDKDHKPYERIQKVSDKLKKNISVYSDADFDKKFGTGWGAKNAKHAYSDMAKTFAEVLDGTKTWNQLYQKALLWSDTYGIGTYFDERLMNTLKATSVAEARAYASGNDKSNDVINFRYAAANMAEMLNRRIEKVNDIQTGRQIRLMSQARDNGDKAKQQKRGKLGKAIDQFVKLQISPYNAAKMVDGYNKSADGAGYALANDMEQSIANRVINEAKLKSFLKPVRDSKSYRDFANGTTKGSVEINGKQASLVEEAYFTGLFRTLEATTNGHPDWSRLDGLKGFFWTDGTTNKKGEMNGKWVELPTSDAFDGAKDMNLRQKVDEQRKMLRDMYDKAMKDIEGNEAAKMYADAVADMFEEGKKMNQKAYTDKYGYAMDMYEKGKYMPTAYKSKNGELNGEWDMMGELHNGLMPGFMSRRVRESGGYLVVRPITQVVDNYIGQTANFTAFSDLADTLSILNDKNNIHGAFSQTIAENFGEAMGNWWEKYTRDVNMVKEADLTGINKTLAEYRNRMMQGALVGSLSVPIKQVSSTFSATGVIDPWAVIKAFRPIIRSSPNKVGAVRNLLFAGREANTEEAQLLKTGILDRLRNKGKGFQMVLDATTIMDTRAVANVYLACCYDVEKNSTLGKDIYKNGKNYKDGLTNAGELLVDSLFSEAVLETQPMFIKQARAEMARSDSEIIKMFSTFRTQQTQNFNRLLTTINEAKAAKKSGDKYVQMQANKELRETVAGQAMAAVSIAGLTILADLVLHKHKKYKDDDDDIDINKVAERWMLNTIESAAGTAWLGSEVSKWLIDQMKGNTGDYASNKEFYGISMGAISSLTSAVNAVSWLYSDMLKGGKHAASNARYVVNYVSTLMGIPTQNAYNLMNMMYQWISDGVGKDVLSGYSAGKYEDIMKEWDGIRTDYGNKLYSAIRAGNEAKAKESVEQMGDKFLSMIKSSSMEQLKSGDADDAEVMNALMTYGNRTAEEAAQDVQNMHLQIDTGYTYLTGTGKQTAETAYKDGSLSRDEFKKLYTKYSGKTSDQAEYSINRIDFKQKYPGNTYQDIKKMYMDGKLSKSEAAEWRYKTQENTTKESAENWVKNLDFQKMTGYEANYTSSSDLYDTYESKEKLGVISFYDKYGSQFSSPKAFGDVFNYLNNNERTDFPTYKTSYGETSKNQSRVITLMNDLLKQKKITYDMAKKIWSEHYGWSTGNKSAWVNVKAA